MNSIVTLWTTAQTPSGFAMPTCGHASLGATGVVVRDRREDSVRTTVLGADVTTKRDAIAPQASFPGTTAWRPPIC